MLTKTEALPRSAGKAQFRAGVIACLPTIPGYWSIGFAAGAIGTLAGFTTLQTALLASLLYAGSAQFLFYSLWAAGAEVASVVLSVALVNLRYLLMSSAMSVYFREHTTLQKIISGLLLTDETFGVAVQQGSPQSKVSFAWMLGLNMAAWINWIIGAWLAGALPPALMEGLSFSLVSMFIGLVLMLWFASRRKLLETASIIIAVAITLTLSGNTDTSVVVIVAASVAATLGLRLFSKGEQ